MVVTAFLNLGASEIVLILLILLILFGADKAPELARSLGKARAELDRARSQFTEALKSEQTRAFETQTAFELERERKIAEVAARDAADAKRAKEAKDTTMGHVAREANPAGGEDHARLVRAAEELGLQTQGLTDAELKVAIRAKVGRDD